MKDFGLRPRKLDHVGVKEAVFPFNRFPGVDTLLGPEMRSTGEVMGLDRDYAIAFAKSQLGAGSKVPMEGTAFVSVKDADKRAFFPPSNVFTRLGFRIIGTSGTQRYLAGNGVPSEKINKVLEGRPHIVDALKNGEVHLVFNTTEGQAAIANSSSIRRAALIARIPYYTTLAGCVAATNAIAAVKAQTFDVRPLQDYREVT